MVGELVGRNKKHPEMFVFIEALAEREGFEPSVQENLYAGFRIRCIRPLCHLSCDLIHAHQKIIRANIYPFKAWIEYLQLAAFLVWLKQG